MEKKRKGKMCYQSKQVLDIYECISHINMPTAELVNYYPQIIYKWYWTEGKRSLST